MIDDFLWKAKLFPKNTCWRHENARTGFQDFKIVTFWAFQKVIDNLSAKRLHVA